jgi:hypothetical protein
MNRRDLLKRLGLALPAVVVVPTAVLAVDSKPQTPDDFMLNGWRVKWGGWREVAQMDIKVGWWAAYGGPGDRWHLYSAYPGNASAFPPGAWFDIACRDDQQIPLPIATEEDLARFKAICLERLKKLIAKAGPPPLKEPICL